MTDDTLLPFDLPAVRRKTRTNTLGQNTAGKRANTSVGTITGGTGKLVGMQGTVRGSGTSDPKAGFNENQTEIEFWIEK
jgi:hypothetical protein